MCQTNNYYNAKDAVATHGYKLMLPLLDGTYRSRFRHGDYVVGREYKALGWTGPKSFEHADELLGGAFHVYPTKEIARKCNLYSNHIRIVRVAVSEYIASGCDGRGSDTACYGRMIIEEEVK